MKSQADCYRALLDGKTLQFYTEDGIEVSLDRDGYISDENGDQCKEDFSCPADWKIKKEPKKLYAYIYSCTGRIEFFNVDHNVMGAKWERCPEYDLEYPCK